MSDEARQTGLAIQTQIKIVVEGREKVEEDNDSRCNHDDTCSDFNFSHVWPEPLEHPTELVQTYTYEQKRETQPKRIEQEQHHSLPKCGRTGRQSQNRTENEADTRCIYALHTHEMEVSSLLRHEVEMLDTMASQKKLFARR